MTDGPMVKVLYTCKACRAIDREVLVRERGAEEDVVKWVEAAAAVCGRDHAKVSPRCRSQHVDLKIPLTKRKDARIGEAIRQ